MKAALFASVALMLAPVSAKAESVLMISIDGLRPGDVIEAEKRDLKIPNLRRFLKEGTYATSVVGVLPTLTYPSHTTLLTGAAPARHGIVNNTTFDPFAINYTGWYWYASDTKAQTLWEAASKAGLSTGNIHWPVSVAAKGLTWTLPQIWRSGHGDDAKLIDALATPGLVAQLEKEVGATYAAGIDESITADENRGRFTARLIADHKPDFTTLYLASLDHEQHATGPGTPEAHAILERIDAIIGTLVAAQMAAHPDGAVAVVSDHGFETISQHLNLFRPFIDAGLITVGADGKVTGWDAVPWSSGGSAAIVLARPQDAALKAKVSALLDTLKADPANGITRIASAAEVAQMGGNADAAFYLDLKAGFVAIPYMGPTIPLLTPATYKGMHGFFPDSPAMRSTFMVMGKGVAKGKTLGEIDMRAIAPTLGKLLGVTLADAEKPAVAVGN